MQSKRNVKSVRNVCGTSSGGLGAETLIVLYAGISSWSPVCGECGDAQREGECVYIVHESVHTLRV